MQFILYFLLNYRVALTLPLLYMSRLRFLPQQVFTDIKKTLGCLLKIKIKNSLILIMLANLS